ncbi:two-component regulator propeller domain-containing protein [Candidatus Poribacteria bacterium]
MQRGLLIFFTALFCLCAITAQAQDTISIRGTLLMLDDKTPHVAVPVEAIRDGEVVDLVLSDESGEYQFVNLNPGQYQVRCQVLEGYVYYRAIDDALQVTPYDPQPAGKDAGEVLYVGRSRPLENIDFRFAPFKKGTWRTYIYLDGLAGNRVVAIHRDPDGVMWFGTWDGVSRYDGKGFMNLTTEDGLVGKRVNAIHRDPDGVMWFGTGHLWGSRNGVSRYDGNEFINFTTEDGLANNQVNAIHRDPNGVMWFGTDGGVSRYDGKRFVNLTAEDGLANNQVTAIHRDPDGVMWFATGTWQSGSGISRYDGKRFVNFTEEDGLADNQVTAIHRDPDGVMWFGTGGGVSRYDGKGFMNLTTEDGLANNRVRAISRDPDGAMWFGTWDGGVSRYDGKGFVNFTIDDGLGNNNVQAIYSDPDGVMWFGTIGGGVSRYDEKGFVNLTMKDGLADNYVEKMYRDPDGVMWFGTWKGGVSRYDGKGFVNLTTEDGLADNWVFAIHRDPDGVMWFGTWNDGVSRYDGKGFINFTTEDGLANNQVTAIHRDPDGVMWFGTRSGVSRYDGKEFINFTAEDGLANNQVWAIHRDPDGVMRFETQGGGVSRYDGKRFVNVSRYDGERSVNFTTKDGLADNSVTGIHGVMWSGTFNGGISMYDGAAWTSLDTRDGLAGNTVLGIFQDPDGSLWFATDGGITRYRRSTTSPGVRITSVRTTEQDYTELAEVPHISSGSYVTIEYSSTDFKTLPEKRQYRYRVKELDSDWRKPTRETEFDYTFKESGMYTFEVQAIDRDLNYSDPASVEIRILPPPFYTRVWLIIGTILAAFLIPTIIYAILLMRQRKQEFEPIQNPYIVGNPIRSKNMFFGRKSDFEFIRIKLSTEDSGLVVVFAGERRSGKTSILFQILEGELGERIVPVLLDMQAMAVDDEAEFFEKVASEINEAFVGAGLEPPVADFRQGNSARAFERFISEAMGTLEGRGLLLLFDEYELIESKIDDGSLRPEIITFFASLLEAHPRLSFIFTGSRHLEGRNIPYWRVLIGKSLYRRISFLSERDALRLITEPVADRVIYPRGIPERIVRLTAGQPFYTQVVCQNMMDRLNEVERNRVRQEDVDAVAQELADNPLPQMIYFWDGLEQEQKGALSLLGEVLENSDRYASAQTLINFAKEQNLELEIESSDLERVLDDLFVNDVLERERAGEGKYEYRFRVDLFRLWVRQAHSVWQQVT